VVVHLAQTDIPAIRDGTFAWRHYLMCDLPITGFACVGATSLAVLP